MSNEIQQIIMYRDPVEAPVGEREAFESEREWRGLEEEFLVRYETSGAYKLCEVQTSWEYFQAGAAYQRAQPQPSAEPVAWISWTVDDPEWKLKMLAEPVHPPVVPLKLYTTPQPSAAVVMPERKTAADYPGYVDSFAAEAAAIHNACLDEFARLNCTEVGRG